jgi:hypothetical protein
MAGALGAPSPVRLRGDRLAKVSGASVLTALGLSVTSVVRLSSQPEMERIAARRIVAVMQNVHAIRDGAHEELPRQSMCLLQPLIGSELAVSEGVPGPGPEPAPRPPDDLLFPALELRSDMVRRGPIGPFHSGRVTSPAPPAVVLLAEASAVTLGGAIFDGTCGLHTRSIP